MASTKAFTTQLVALTLLTLHIGRSWGVFLLKPAFGLPGSVAAARRRRGDPGKGRADPGVAHKYFQAQDFLFLGRGIHYPIALEGALKLKEISYIHAEGYPAGEMKTWSHRADRRGPAHGALLPENEILEKVQSNLQEVKARGGKIIALTDQEEGGRLQDRRGRSAPGPKIHWDALPDPLYRSAAASGLPHSRAAGTDVDQPRNLAKSVTVE